MGLINKKKPYFTISLMAINIIVFIVLEIMGDTENAEFMLAHGANYPECIISAGEYWRLLTAMFMHFGFMHILNNMVILGSSAVILEDDLGHFKFLILYFLSGIGASLLSFLHMYTSGEWAVSAGASGAIFGVVGALLWVVLRNKGHYKDLTGKGILFMIALTLYAGVTDGGVDNYAHVGGLISGFIFAIPLYRIKGKNIDFDDENLYT